MGGIIRLSRLTMLDEWEAEVSRFEVPGRDLQDGLYLVGTLLSLCADSIKFTYRRGGFVCAVAFGPLQEGIAGVLFDALDEYVQQLMGTCGEGRYMLEWLPAEWAEGEET